jgi:hypothetical protein
MANEPEIPVTVRQRLFAHAAAAHRADSRVVASCLTDYCAAHRMDEATLAAWLGLPSVEALHGLALCARPNPTSPSFEGELTALAAYTGCDAARLRRLLIALDTE